jgi:transketolase
VRTFESGFAPQLTVITHGRIAAEALRAAEALAKQGIYLRILLCEYIAPYDKLADELLPLICGDGVLLLEEEIRHGGFGMHLQDALLQKGLALPSEIMAAKSGFVTPASGETPLAAAGLDAAHIEKTLCRMAQKKENEYVKG